MMKDMKWKQIDTTYAGKAYQVEAEEINLHGEVNITGSLSVNGGSLSTPTAADVSYDNTTSGLTADDVQEAIDEVNDKTPIIITAPVTNYVVSTAWGDIFWGGTTNDIEVAVPFDTADYNVLVSFVPSDSSIAIPVLRNIDTNRYNVNFCRGTTGTINGSIIISATKK